METQPETIPADTALRLEEYKLAQEAAASVDERIWQIAGIIVAASLATFGFIASRDERTPSTFWASLFGGFLSTALLYLWYLVMRRFSFYIQVRYYRMREIEPELGIWIHRYVHYLDQPKEMLAAKLSEAEREQLAKLQKEFDSTIPKERGQKIMEYLVVLVTLVWLLWVVYQAASVYWAWLFLYFDIVI